MLSKKLTFLLLLSSLSCFGQEPRFELQKLYKQNLETLLNPENRQKIVLLFIVSPNERPDEALRIVDRDGLSYAEVRSAEKNIWAELFRQTTTHKNSEIQIKISRSETTISKSFRDKLQYMVSNVISRMQQVQHPHLGIYDNTVYRFSVYQSSSSKSATIDFELAATDYNMQAANLLRRILADIKQGTFDESKYGDLQTLRRIPNKAP